MAAASSRPANPVATLLGTWFGCGYSPFAPGTAGSLGGLLLAYLLHVYAGWPPIAIGLVGFSLIAPGIWAAGRVAIASGRKDPGLVVVDEVIGQCITVAGAVSLNWKSWFLAFFIFRVLDVWKPAPARQLEGLHGGTGIVADDVMAGVYGALVLYLAGWFNLY